jgi:hypothetical protein
MLLVTLLPLLCFDSSFSLTLAMRVCSLELLFSILLNISQGALEIVELEVELGCFLLGFRFSSLCISPYVA